jgi:hypothetical protein
MPAQNNFQGEIPFEIRNMEFLLLTGRRIRRICHAYQLHDDLVLELPDAPWVIERIKEIAWMACIHFYHEPLKPLWLKHQEELIAQGGLIMNTISTEEIIRG